jgi:hypothetical protein
MCGLSNAKVTTFLKAGITCGVGFFTILLLRKNKVTEKFRKISKQEERA